MPFCSIRIANATENKNIIDVLHQTLDESSIYYKNRNKNFMRENIFGQYEKFIKSSILTRDNKSCFYIHEEKQGGYVSQSLLALIPICEYFKRKIKLHEDVNHSKVRDIRLCLRDCLVQSEPVMLFFDGSIYDYIEKNLNMIAKKYDEEYVFSSKTGREHKFWRVHNVNDIIKIQVIFKEITKFYLADGHHRINALELLYHEFAKQEHSSDSINIFANIISSKSLKTKKFIRSFACNEDYILKQNKEVILKALSNYFNIKRITNIFQTDWHCQFVLGLETELFALSSMKKSLKEDTLSDVDILERYINPLFLHIGVPFKDTGVFMGMSNDKTIELDYMKMDNMIWFVFSSPSVSDIIQISDINKKLPEKSTFFEPKIEDGVIFYPPRDLML